MFLPVRPLRSRFRKGVLFPERVACCAKERTGEVVNLLPGQRDRLRVSTSAGIVRPTDGKWERLSPCRLGGESCANICRSRRWRVMVTTLDGHVGVND